MGSHFGVVFMKSDISPNTKRKGTTGTALTTKFRLTAVPLTELNENWQVAQSNKLSRKSIARLFAPSYNMKRIQLLTLPVNRPRKILFIFKMCFYLGQLTFYCTMMDYFMKMPAAKKHLGFNFIDNGFQQYYDPRSARPQ